MRHWIVVVGKVSLHCRPDRIVVGTHVLLQVIGSGKGSATIWDWTCIWSFTGMRSNVTSEMFLTFELTSTTWLWAFVRLFGREGRVATTTDWIRRCTAVGIVVRRSRSVPFLLWVN